VADKVAIKLGYNRAAARREEISLNASEQKLFDGFTFVLGIFLGALCAAAAAVTAGALDSRSRLDTDDEIAMEAIADRLAPVGRIALLGDVELAVAAAPVVAPTRVDTVLSGPQVFNEACYLCHAPPGVPGAPVVGDVAAWEQRAAQGLQLLQEHAINGYQGVAGFMPAKGGRVDLSDDEVRSAVEYMLEQLP